MKFNLKKDLVFFDVESTGLHVIRDRIIQIALLKYKKDTDTPEELNLLVNPGIPISAEAMEVHGIRPEDVANKPTFRQVASEIASFIGDADLSGYNAARFDVPILLEEFHRAGIDFSMEGRKILDVQRIFYKMEPRTLAAAHRFYTGEDFEDAHDAMADVRATVNVLKGQLEMYADRDYKDKDGNIVPNPIQNDVDQLVAFTSDLNFIDATQKLKYNNDREVVFAFGKHNNKLVRDVYFQDPDYFHWILNKDFSVQVKSMLKKIKSEIDAQKNKK